MIIHIRQPADTHVPHLVVWLHMLKQVIGQKLVMFVLWGWSRGPGRGVCMHFRGGDGWVMVNMDIISQMPVSLWLKHGLHKVGYFSCTCSLPISYQVVWLLPEYVQGWGTLCPPKLPSSLLHAYFRKLFLTVSQTLPPGDSYSFVSHFAICSNSQKAILKIHEGTCQSFPRSSDSNFPQGSPTECISLFLDSSLRDLDEPALVSMSFRVWC